MSHSLETSLPCQRAQLTYKPNMTQKESLGPRPEHTSSQTLLTRIHYLIEVVQLSRNSNNLYKDPFRSYPRLQQKTLRRLLLLRCLQLEGMILAIHGFSYAARSSPRFQHYNVPTSMQAVMNNDGYLCMTIPIIKRRDLGDYKKITTCRSCSC